MQIILVHLGGSFMVLLGLGDHVDCGSAILIDGKIVSAVNDERLVREKMVFGIPRESIRLNLEHAGLSPDDIDAVAIGTKNQHIVPEYTDFRDGWFGLERSRFKQILFDIGSKVAPFREQFPWLERIYYWIRTPAYAHRRRVLRKVLANELGISAPVHFIDHHFCHAAAAYYSSGFGPNATVLTLDGGGDGISAKAFSVTGGAWNELAAVPSFDSLGNFYSYITQICGFKAGRHEGKITGLAAHGEPLYTDLLDSLLTFKDGQFVNVGGIFFNSAVEQLRERLSADFQIENLAASVQVHAERLVTEFARHWVRHSGHQDVAMAGGVVANVRVNHEVHALPEVDRCFIHPGMGDCGIGVGAALAAYYERNPRTERDTRCLDTVFLGPEFSDSEILRELEISDVSYRRPDDIEAEIADLLAQGAVVARFHGRMEYGPRALGNRSILYQPTDPTVNDWLNEALVRTEFMPFAPSVLEDHAEQCFLDIQGAERTSRFMTITFDCTDWMKEHCPGVVHIDGTARPQVVRKEDNPSYYRIIDQYRKRTGLPAIINTSFNMHEEPIVCTPEDALRAFLQGHLDYLAIGNFLAKNPAPIREAERTSRGTTRELALDYPCLGQRNPFD